MSLFRRYSAAPMAAAVLLLGACAGGDTAPTAPNLDEGPLYFNISPYWVLFENDLGDPPPTAPEHWYVSGLIAIGGYPAYGQIQYGPETPPGLFQLDLTPNFQREPLAWKFTAHLNQQLAAPLAPGYYTAEVPVTVGGALNNPQTLWLAYSNCGYCLFYGSMETDELDGSEPQWNRSQPFNPAGTGYYYQDWRLFLEAGESVFVHSNGGGCGTYGGTLGDPYLHVFDKDMTVLIDVNDDTDCLNSQVEVTNGTGMAQEYLVRASTFSSHALGSYTVIVDDYNFYSLRADETEHPKLVAKRAAGGN